MIKVQEIKCTGCGANINIIPGQTKFCSYCGKTIHVSDENSHSYSETYIDVAEVQRAENEKERLHLAREMYYNSNAERRSAKKVIWFSVSAFLIASGVLGCVYDIKWLIVLLGIGSFLTCLGLFVFVFKSHKGIWKWALGIAGIGILASYLFFFREVPDFEAPMRSNGSAVLDEYVPGITAVELKSILSSIGEFATSEYQYSGYSKITKYREVLGWEVPFTDHEIGIYYSGTIKTGYKVGNIGIEVEGQKIIVKLPKAEILDNYIDTHRTEESNNIFNPIDPNEVSEKLTALKEAELAKAEVSGIYSKAETSVKVLISDLFAQFDGYTVVYK